MGSKSTITVPRSRALLIINDCMYFLTNEQLADVLEAVNDAIADIPECQEHYLGHHNFQVVKDD